MTDFERGEFEKGTSLWREAWLRLQQNKLAMACLYLFCGICLMCFVGSWIYPVDPNETHLENRSMAPNWNAPLGTEHLGRDVLARVLYGGMVSLAVGFVATLVSVSIGVVYGTVAAYCGGRVDSLMMRIVDVLYAVPFTVIVIILATFFREYFKHQLLILFIAIGCVEWLTMARIVRGQVLSLVKQPFVAAATSMGHHPIVIMFWHIVPNVLGPVIVYTTLTVPAVMRLEAVLSFLGLGIQPPNSSWGTLIKEGADRIQSDPWLLMGPAAFFSITLFCLNFMGDGLRDAFDPKSSRD